MEITEHQIKMNPNKKGSLRKNLKISASNLFIKVLKYSQNSVEPNFHNHLN